MKRVLVAEDDPGSAKLVTLVLRRLGFEVVLRSDGPSALEDALSGSFQLVLMDMNLPGMDGLAVVRAIRERERQTGAHLPVIALTGNAFPEDRARCLSAGMDDWLTKPLELDILEERARRWAAG